MYAPVFLFLLSLAGSLAETPRKRDLVALAYVGREYRPYVKMTIQSYVNTREKCPSDENIDMLLVTDDIELRSSYTKHIKVYALPQEALTKDEIEYMARFETVNWPLIEEYGRLIQIGPDVVINNCLSPVFDMIEKPDTVYACPVTSENVEMWNLQDFPQVAAPFNSGIMAFQLTGIMIEHMRVMSTWIQSELDMDTPHHGDQAFVNVYASQHTTVNTTGAISNRTVMINPPPQHPEQRVMYDEAFIHFVSTPGDEINNTRAKYRHMHKHINV
jgi:lipopolysaccharide biosynthesis glycosyltransferase